MSHRVEERSFGLGCLSPMNLLYFMVVLSGNLPFKAGVVVTAKASVRPILTFQNFSLRCDKSDPGVSFKQPWNWDLSSGKRIAVITTNSYLRYQLIVGLAGLVPPVSGDFYGDGVIGWPVGGEGGLDSKLRVSHALSFLSNVYGDCLENSRISYDEVWKLLEEVSIYPQLIIKELTKTQKDFFFLALSVLFSFDLYLIPKTKFLMSKAAKPLRRLLLKQIEGKSLIATTTNSRFLREFCADGLVLGSFGEILFSGELSESMQWARDNLEGFDVSDSEDDKFDAGLNLTNLDSPDEGGF